MFAIALYTGMRPNEFYSAHLEGNIITAINSKRKNVYLIDVDKIEFCSLRILRNRFNKLFHNHKLYDLRTTFYTRCQECNVSPVARDEFVGHSLGQLGNTYTDLSTEFLIREANKLNY